MSLNRWPEVDIVADALRSKERTLGKLELLAHPAGSDWQIQKLALINDAGRIDAEGSWRNVASRSQTRLDVVVDVKEAGGFLRRFGWPDAVKGAPTKIDGQLSWDGAPSDFDYPTLAGSFKLRVGRRAVHEGRSRRRTPARRAVAAGAAAADLARFPRCVQRRLRVRHDHRATCGCTTASMHTDDFRLVGPAAAVNIAGDVDLARETQQLKVRVQPSLSSGVSAARRRCSSPTR